MHSRNNRQNTLYVDIKFEIVGERVFEKRVVRNGPFVYFKSGP